MRPFLPEGLVLAVERAPLGRPPAVGDILVLEPAGGEPLVVHRLIGQAGNSYVTKGDNRLEADPPWDAAQIWGRVVMAQLAEGHWRRPSPRIGTLLARSNRGLPRKLTRIAQFLLSLWVWLPEEYPQLEGEHREPVDCGRR